MSGGLHITSICFCRGLSLRSCEDIDDVAVLILSKYTAAAGQNLLQRFSSLELASTSTADTGQPAAGNPSKAALPVAPAHHKVSLQRVLLGSSLRGMRQAAVPSNPHKQPVLDLEAGAEQNQGSSSAQCEPQQQHEQPLWQHSSLHTGKPCFCCACQKHFAAFVKLDMEISSLLLAEPCQSFHALPSRGLAMST